jgi:hypothetical protein
MSIGRGGVSENRLCYPLVQGRSTIEVSGHLMVISVICSEKVLERPIPEVQQFSLDVSNVLKSDISTMSYRQ